MHINCTVFALAYAKITGSKTITHLKSDMRIRAGNQTENSPFFRNWSYLMTLSPHTISLPILASMLGPLLKSSSIRRTFLDFAAAQEP
jgi:hypothetical protein